MVAKVDVTRRGGGLKRARRIAREWPDTVWVAATNTQRVVEPKLLQDMAKAPGKPKYPIAWQSERQRRAFFATNGFGRGIPTRRTGGATKAWRMSLKRGGGLIVSKISNPNKYLVYVRYTRHRQTARIQRMHLNTGWRNANTIIDRWRREWKRVFRIDLRVEFKRRFG